MFLCERSVPGGAGLCQTPQAFDPKPNHVEERLFFFFFAVGGGKAVFNFLNSLTQRGPRASSRCQSYGIMTVMVLLRSTAASFMALRVPSLALRRRPNCTLGHESLATWVSILRHFLGQMLRDSWQMQGQNCRGRAYQCKVSSYLLGGCS